MGALTTADDMVRSVKIREVFFKPCQVQITTKSAPIKNIGTFALRFTLVSYKDNGFLRCVPFASRRDKNGKQNRLI